MTQAVEPREFSGIVDLGPALRAASPASARRRQAEGGAHQKTGGLWQAAEGKLNRAVDSHYLQRYDRRAKPQPTAAPAPGATPSSPRQ